MKYRYQIEINIMIWSATIMNIVQCIHQSWYQLLITVLIWWIWFLIPWIMIQLWKGCIICLDIHQLFNLVVVQSISQLQMNEAKVEKDCSDAALDAALLNIQWASFCKVGHWAPPTSQYWWIALDPFSRI